jgi:hypothetical protein
MERTEGGLQGLQRGGRLLAQAPRERQLRGSRLAQLAPRDAEVVQHLRSHDKSHVTKDGDLTPKEAFKIVPAFGQSQFAAHC